MAVEESQLQGIQLTWLSLAGAHLQSKNYEIAHALYSVLAANGNIEALVQVGLMHLKGIYVKPDIATAMKHLETACKKADFKKDADITISEHKCLAQAAYLLGEQAVAVKDNDQALFWYDFADRHGNKETGIKMAQIHMSPGIFEKERPKEIMECLGRTLAKGNKQAAQEFIRWYEDRPFWASKIEDEAMKIQAANFYLHAGKAIPSELQSNIKNVKNGFKIDNL